MSDIEKGKLYTVKATDNTNALAESLGFNINDRRALVVDEWFGKVNVRVNMDKHGVWTDIILLDKSDLKKEKV